MMMIIGLTILLVSPVLGNAEMCDDTDQGLKVCYESRAFTRVIELDTRPNKNLKLRLYPASNNTIAPYVLNSTHITAIRVEGGGDVWAYLSHSTAAMMSLQDDSFAGMPGVKSLVLYYVIINFNNENPLAPLRSLVRLDFEAINLMEVPRKMLASLRQLERLNLKDNRIRVIRSNSFDSLESLEYLDLSGNGITDIESGAFDMLSELRELALARNIFSPLSDGIFQAVRKLNGLYLEKAFDHRKFQLQVGIFDGLTKLTNLTLVGNRINKIPMRIFNHLTSLRNLDISGNKIKEITPRTFGGLILDQLDLSWNKIKVIESDTFNGLSVKKLSLRYNCIVKLKPKAFNGLIAGDLNIVRNYSTKIDFNNLDGLNSSRLKNLPTYEIDLRFNLIGNSLASSAEVGLVNSVILRI